MRHKKTILFTGVLVGLAIVLHKSHMVTNIDKVTVEKQPPLDASSKLINEVENAGAASGARSVFNNIFPTRTGDLTTQIFNPSVTNDLIAPKVFIIESEEDYLKRYTLANYMPTRLNAAAVAVQQALPPPPLPPSAIPKLNGLHSFNVGGSGFGAVGNSVLGYGRALGG